MRFGFAQKPDVPAALAAHSAELGPNVAQASFFLGREVPVPSLHPDVPLWQEKLYAFMTPTQYRARLLSDTAREGRGIGHQGGDVSALHAS